MSIWTYVIGVVEFSTNKSDDIILRIEKCLGNIVEYEDLGKYWTKLPMGSEGSLTYEIHNGFIIFKGDLRDFYGKKDMKELDDYFTNIFLELKQNKIYVGDYVIKSWNETDGERIWKYNYE